MRVLETYPPSSILVGLIGALLLFIDGLELLVPFLLGVGTAMLGARLDDYGARRSR